MARKPKFFIRGTVVEISTRIEVGLLMPPTPVIKLLLTSVLASAQTKHPVTICAFTFMENHFHLIIVVQDPACIPDFMLHIKRESAHYLNSLLGRRKRKVWEDGYDSPVILDSENVFKRLTYLYTNPVVKNLTPTAKEWCHLNTYENLYLGNTVKKVRNISRPSVPKLPKASLSLTKLENIAKKIEDSNIGESELSIDPYAWMACFADSAEYSVDEVRARIIQSIERVEQEQKKSGVHPPTKNYLQTRPMVEDFTPKKFGKRMSCFASMKETRKAFLSWLNQYYQSLPKFSRDPVRRRKPGPYPPGFFAPGGFLSANLLPRYSYFGLV